MKIMVTTLFWGVLFLLLPPNRAGAEGKNLAQIQVRVLDDVGQPVTDVQVNMSTFERWIPGDNFGRDQYQKATEYTDTNGYCVVKLSGQYNRFGIMAVAPSGYYWNTGSEYVFTSRVQGQWWPWNPGVTLVLQRVVNPVPLYAKKVEFCVKNNRQEDQPLGYDLVKGDTVDPFGRGVEPDFVLLVHSALEREAMSYWGDKPRPYKLHDVTLNLSFSNDGDGIQPVVIQHSGSVFRIPREAPETGYQTNWMKRTFRKEDEAGVSDVGAVAGYFFRVRTRKDAEGKILSALYGKILGDIEVDRYGCVRFTYYLNPTPNDRNLEFDPKRNLFTDLEARERVTEP